MSPKIAYLHSAWLELRITGAHLTKLGRTRPVPSCPVLSCPVLSCPVLSCPALPSPALLTWSDLPLPSPRRWSMEGGTGGSQYRCPLVRPVPGISADLEQETSLGRRRRAVQRSHAGGFGARDTPQSGVWTDGAGGPRDSRVSQLIPRPTGRDRENRQKFDAGKNQPGRGG